MEIENGIDQLKKEIKKKIFQSNLNLLGYVKERQTILDLFKRCINNGESNSALLIGPRESGKTTLVNDIFDELQKDISFEDNCVLVRLNGLVHTDDKLALQSITVQMDLDNAIDGKVFGSFAENLAFLLACLQSGNKDFSKSVLFILEEFDLFCSHHNQTLLYNLFDVSQNAQAPICVLGITSRLDVIELFEKRVKSRFSHRQIFLFIEDNLEKRLEKIGNYLTIKDSNLSKKLIKNWNDKVTELLKNKQFKNLMQRLMDMDLSERCLKNLLISVVSQLSPQSPYVKLEQFEDEMKQYERDDSVAIIEGLSAVEFCILVSIKHHCEIYDNDAFNFEMIYSRYVKFADANSNVQPVPRAVVAKAFEHLEHVEFIMGCNSATSKLQKDHKSFKLQLDSEQITSAVKRATHLPIEIVQWSNASLL